MRFNNWESELSEGYNVLINIEGTNQWKKRNNK